MPTIINIDPNKVKTTYEVNPGEFSAYLSIFMSRVYGWMMVGILITGAIAYQISHNADWMRIIVENRLIFFGLIILQLAAVISLGAAIEKMTTGIAATIYLLYSALTGTTLSVIFLAYTEQSITSAFAVTAFSFGGMSLWGFVTKRDLGPLASFCMMGLFGLIGVALLSFFFPSLMGEVGQKVTGVVGIIVFAGLTAYDTQKLRRLGFYALDSGQVNKRAVHGALMLYLDFINLFLSILRLMGNRK